MPPLPGSLFVLYVLWCISVLFFCVVGNCLYCLCSMHDLFCVIFFVLYVPCWISVLYFSCCKNFVILTIDRVI